MKQQLRLARQTVKRSEDKAKAAEDRLAKLKGDSVDSIFQSHRRGTTKLSEAGSCSVGLRRNFGNASAQDFGSTTLDKVSRQTVTRAEVDTAAAFVASIRGAHLDAAVTIMNLSTASLLAPSAQRKLLVCCHALRSDATNSSVWQDSKLHCCEIESGYMLDPAGALAEGVLQTWATFSGLADIQRVTSATGVGRQS